MDITYDLPTNSDPRHIDYVYDKQGRQTHRHDRRDDPVTGAIERTVQQAFNADGTLQEQKATGTALEEHRSVYDYDPDNNMTSVATYSGGSATPNVSELAATWTSAGQLKDWSETIYPPGGDTPVTMTGSNDWAQDGLKTQSTIDSQTSAFEWFVDGNEKTFAPYGGFGSFSSTYFDNGALQQMSFPDGQVLTHGYDAAGRLSERVLAFSGVKLSAWEAIGYDEDDHRLSEQVTQLQPSGPKTGASAYGYDDLGRLESFKHAFEALPTGYTLDDAGNITAEGAKLFTYENNRLKLRTELLSVFEYGYDLFGNQITETETGKAPKTTEYNAASHTKKVTEPDGKWVEYRYDGLERLVSRLDSAGAVTLFFRDGLSEQIAVETDAQGSVTTRYLTDAYSIPRGKIDIGNSTGRSYYMTDPRGNVTQMLQRSTQDVKAAFNYGPYGEDKGSDTVGNWDSRLKFQMAPKDPMSGSYTIGPRVMDPGINRFVGADMYVGAAANLGLQMDPLTGNRYLYAGANPAGFIDDGHERTCIHERTCPAADLCDESMCSNVCGADGCFDRCNGLSCWDTPAPTYNECTPRSQHDFYRSDEGREQRRSGNFCSSEGRFADPYVAPGAVKVTATVSFGGAITSDLHAWSGSFETAGPVRSTRHGLSPQQRIYKVPGASVEAWLPIVGDTNVLSSGTRMIQACIYFCLGGYWRGSDGWGFLIGVGSPGLAIDPLGVSND